MDNNKELNRCKELLKIYKLLISHNKYNNCEKIYDLKNEKYILKKKIKK